MESPKYVVRIFGKTKKGEPYTGTGFLLNSQGHVATCWHVVRDADYIFVKLPYTQEWLCDVLEYRERHDIAILEPPFAPDPPTAHATLHPDWFGLDKKGQEVDLYGYSSAPNNADAPLQFKCTISGISPRYGLIMLDGTVNRGDSGGPILNSDGDVIGMANFNDPERPGQAMARPISRLCKLLTETKLAFGAKAGSGKLAGRAFTSLNDLLENKAVRDAVNAYGGTFEKASRQISVLHAYKKVHDLLYQVEFGCYNSLVMDARDFPDDEHARDKISIHVDNLRRYVVDAEEIAKEALERRNRIEKVRDQLKAAHTALHEAETLSKLTACNDALYLLRHLISGAQSSFNVLLNEVASELDMQSLAAVMDSLRMNLSAMELPPNVVDNLQLGFDDLAQLGTDLRQRTKEHDNWQQLDDALRGCNRNSANLLSEIEAFWRILISYVAKACDLPEVRAAGAPADDRSDWVDDLIPDGTTDQAALILRELKKALKQRDLTLARRHFGSLLQQSADQLDRVDKKLLRVCEKITDFKDPLRTLVENLK
jgi:hypothetical protein